MKDLILITAYTPDAERISVLDDLLESIDREHFDVMISSHSSISDEVVEKSDYFIFQKKNVLLTDLDQKIKWWFENESLEISTTEFKNFNHLIAAGSLILNGLSAAKSFGYEKVHFLEYDSLIIDDTEFRENSQTLEEYSVVWYKHHDLHTVFSLISFNVKKIKPEWFDLSDNVFYSFLESSGDNILESFNSKMIGEEKAFCKEVSSLLSGKIETNKYNSNEEDWITVVAQDDKFILFNFNHTGINDITVIYNDSEMKRFLNTEKGTWITRALGKTEEINKIKIFLNDTLIKSYDFSVIDKEKYIKNNWLKYK